MKGSLAATSPCRFLPVIGLMAAIFIVSSQPGDKLHLPTYLNYDKAWHLLEYGLLAATCFFALPQTHPTRSRTSTAFGVVCFAFLYGVTDEFHQSFVPLRDSSFADVVADTLGAAIVAAAWWWRAGSVKIDREKRTRANL